MRIFYATDNHTAEVRLKDGSLMLVFGPSEANVQEALVTQLLNWSDSEEMRHSLKQVLQYVQVSPTTFSS